MASRVPALLATYLRPRREGSLTLLTDVLGASANWLVQRYVCALLRRRSADDDDADGGGVDEDEDDQYAGEYANVVFLSFLRDYAFWKEGAGRAGIDLDVLSSKGRFVFVDGLTGLYPVHGVDPRLGGQGHGTKGRVLSDASLHGLGKELDEAIAAVQPADPGLRTVMILDHPDLLLAASGGSVSAQGLLDTILDAREKVYSSIVTVSADEPLISSQNTLLEKQHAAFALSLAHQAELVLSLRMLDTGTARDVSGVLRVTHGGDSDHAVADGQELLYFIGGDCGVRVFERGQ